MRVLANHTLEGAKPAAIPGGDLMRIRRVLVIHFTAGASAMSSVESMRAQRLSAHLVIDRDGTVYQCRGFDRTCGHAGPPGKSRWRDPHTGALYDGVNGCGIGIELANAGDSVREVARGRYYDPATALKARHKNGGKLTEWEPFPQPLLTACFAAARAIVERYHLDDVVGHEDIAPERKPDPGPAFPMLKLREFCGFTGLPKVHWPG